MQVLTVIDQSQVAESRRAAVELARRAGFGETDAGRVALVATELATNLVKHSGGGRLLAGLTDGAEVGTTALELIALDKGSGIANLAAALTDGYSTAGSAGRGLGAVRRQAERFEIYAAPERGTAVLARLQPGDGRASTAEEAWGAVCAPKSGEEVCGDDWQVSPKSRARDAAGGRTLMVADGLGHGPKAAEASTLAVRLFDQAVDLPLPELMGRLHAGLRPTRGAAVSLARFDTERRVVRYCGVGNVAGVLASPRTGEARRMVSQNGAVGHAVRTVTEFEYPYPDTAEAPLVVMHSDGLSASWAIGAYPGLVAAHPSLVAAVLFRDFGRDRDDATVLAARGPEPAT